MSATTGGFGLANAPGQGMVARFAWFDDGGGTWSETQDIVVYPGCNRMTVDLATNPAAAVNDESTVYKAGWRGIRISALRFDLEEDPGARDFSVNEIRLADDAAFSGGDVPDHVQLEPSPAPPTSSSRRTQGSCGRHPDRHHPRQRRHQHLQLGRQRDAQRNVLGVHHRDTAATPSARRTRPVRCASSGRCHRRRAASCR